MEGREKRDIDLSSFSPLLNSLRTKRSNCGRDILFLFSVPFFCEVSVTTTTPATATLMEKTQAAATSSATTAEKKTGKRPRDEGEEEESGADAATKTGEDEKSESPKKKTAATPTGGATFDLGNNRRLVVKTFYGKTYVDIREWYDAGGELKPGKKGISLTPVRVAFPRPLSWAAFSSSHSYRVPTLCTPATGTMEEGEGSHGEGRCTASMNSTAQQQCHLTQRKREKCAEERKEKNRKISERHTHNTTQQ